MKRQFAILIVSFFLSACGIEPTSTSNTASTNKTPGGYRVVDGEYTMLVKSSTVKCAVNGESQEAPLSEFSMKLRITQKENDLMFETLSLQGDDPIYKVGAITYESNTLHKDSHFTRTISRTITATILDKVFSGGVNYFVSGDFNEAGWGGTYGFDYTLSNVEVLTIATCRVSTTFIGERSPLTV